MELMLTGGVPYLPFRKGFPLRLLQARLESGKIL